MSANREEFLPEYPLYEEDVDSPEEVEVDYGYHSIGKNIQVNNAGLYVYCTCTQQDPVCVSQFNFTVQFGIEWV